MHSALGFGSFDVVVNTLHAQGVNRGESQVQGHFQLDRTFWSAGATWDSDFKKKKKKGRIFELFKKWDVDSF